MKNKNNKLGIDIEYAIREFSKNKNEEYLQYLFETLKEESLIITVDKECQPTISEDSEHSIPIINKNNIPTVIMTMDCKFWFSCFTSDKEIPDGFKYKYQIKKIKFKELIDISLKENDIEGIAINHKNKNGVCITKTILENL